MKEKLKVIADTLKDLQENQKLLRKIGVDVFDYSEKWYEAITTSLSMVLTKEGVEDFEYYVYEFKEGFKWTYTPEPYGKKVVTIETFDDFYEYLVKTQKLLKVD